MKVYPTDDGNRGLIVATFASHARGDRRPGRRRVLLAEQWRPRVRSQLAGRACLSCCSAEQQCGGPGIVRGRFAFEGTLSSNSTGLISTGALHC